jgi:AmmeMemoRadiSam system protein B
MPFLQTVLPGCSIVPILCDDGAIPGRLADALAPVLAADPYALVVVSSDLSHFLPYAEAQRLDRAFLAAVAAGDVAAVTNGQACGQIPILALMAIAQRLHWTAKILHYANSGDTCGPRTSVVGYGAVAFCSDGSTHQA